MSSGTVLALEPAILSRLGEIGDWKLKGKRIRCHGDFHLGQVLFTGKDFAIIDLMRPTTAITTPGATTTLPVVIPPGLTEAAPFTNATGAAEELPTWLVATAVLALLAAAGSTAAVAWHLAEREARG